MTAIAHARRYLAHRPAEAVRDLVGLAALCTLTFAGFALPSLF